MFSLARSRLVLTRQLTKYARDKTGECLSDIFEFSKPGVLRKIFEGQQIQQPPFGAKICSDINFMRSLKTVCFSEQMMSADKYPRIFSRQFNGAQCLCKFEATIIINLERFKIRDNIFSWPIVKFQRIQAFLEIHFIAFFIGYDFIFK